MQILPREHSTSTYLEELFVLVAKLESMEVSQRRDGERLSKSPGAANELNICPIFKLSDISRLVEVCQSRDSANFPEVRFVQGKPFQIAG